MTKTAIPTRAESRPLPDYSQIPRIRVTRALDGLAPGYLFMSPQSLLEPEKCHGPQIADDRGRTLWFHPVPEGEYATNVRVQEYRGEPVLTWWQGQATETGVGDGTGYVLDRGYRTVATVRAGGDQPFDLHEFLLTGRGTALLVSYQPKPCDLSSIGGPADGVALDSVVEEVDVETGEVLLHWSGLEHVPLAESDLPAALADPYDHLHVNSVAVDDDGDLLITARMSSALYKVDRRTGEIIWRLGSAHSSFVLGVGARCHWQHDGQPCGNGVYRFFDNATNELLAGYESRVVWVRADTATSVATFVRQVTHPEHLSAIAEGNAQDLPNGNTLVGWGRAARISEFSPAGDLLFDAHSPTGNGWTTYRVYRHPWDGMPETPPQVRFEDGRVHAVWNGATGVARWRLYAGRDQDALEAVGTVEWDGLDTSAPLPDDVRFMRVEALDTGGRPLGASPVTALGS
ncbi:arylsulfotransferase family protein [Actinomadura citrea]|uniref:arylsulfotransferase family protein n=1 Tax=Actinomadura citrea TaxID=46158 RepID=UPI002E2A20E4|nr:arylsulfotransferase family protein [Actinomadura citrea]